MKKIKRSFLLFLILLLPALMAHAQEPVVQAILFYSPTCPHCQDVITNVLPPLKEQYGSQLQMVGIDTRVPAGSRLYQIAMDRYAAPDARRGIPALLVGDVLLVGAKDIPEQFPALIEGGLSTGGVGWPDLPGLREAVPDLPVSADQEISTPVGDTTGEQNVQATAVATAPEESVLIEATLDETAVPATGGFGAAWFVLVGMIAALGYAFWRLSRAKPLQVPGPGAFSGWAIPLMVLIGLVVASYLAYIEITQATAVCGPVGDCNAVQASPYAAIFGVPIAVLGLGFYLAVLGMWLLMRLMAHPPSWAPGALLLLTIGGTLFSVYLTALEIFVIEAVCAWCLSSAVITTALLLFTVQQFNTRTDKVSKKRRARQSRRAGARH